MVRWYYHHNDEGHDMKTLIAWLEQRHHDITWAYLDRDNLETAQEGHSCWSTKVAYTAS